MVPLHCPMIIVVLIIIMIATSSRTSCGKNDSGDQASKCHISFRMIKLVCTVNTAHRSVQRWEK